LNDLLCQILEGGNIYGADAAPFFLRDELG
jgi:hypothetical protein